MRAARGLSQPHSTCTLCFPGTSAHVTKLTRRNRPHSSPASTAVRYHPPLDCEKRTEHRYQQSGLCKARIPDQPVVDARHVQCGEEEARQAFRRPTASCTSHYREPKRTGICWTGTGISCLCAGSPTTALPLVRRFPPHQLHHCTSASGPKPPNRSAPWGRLGTFPLSLGPSSCSAAALLSYRPPLVVLPLLDRGSCPGRLRGWSPISVIRTD